MPSYREACNMLMWQRAFLLHDLSAAWALRAREMGVGGGLGRWGWGGAREMGVGGAREMGVGGG